MSESEEVSKEVIGWFRDSCLVKAFDMGNITIDEFLKIIREHLREGREEDE